MNVATKVASEIESCLYELYNSHLDKDYKLHIKRLALNFSKNESLTTRLAEGVLTPHALVRLSPEELGNKVVMHARQKVIEKAITNSTIEPSTFQLVMNNEKDADRVVPTDTGVAPTPTANRAATPPPSAQPPRRHGSVGSDGGASAEESDGGGAGPDDSGNSTAGVQHMLKTLVDEDTGEKAGSTPASITATAARAVSEPNRASPEHMPSPTGVGMEDNDEDTPYDPEQGVTFDPLARRTFGARPPVVGVAASRSAGKQHANNVVPAMWQGTVQNGEHTQVAVASVVAAHASLFVCLQEECDTMGWRSELRRDLGCVRSGHEYVGVDVCSDDTVKGPSTLCAHEPRVVVTHAEPFAPHYTTLVDRPRCSCLNTCGITLIPASGDMCSVCVA